MVLMHYVSYGNGVRLTNFVIANVLMIGGIIFHHKNIHKKSLGDHEWELLKFVIYLLTEDIETT